ncbi:MAG: hypothetical protein QXU98_03190 [Candidatus Parvarchaeota archaeon]
MVLMEFSFVVLSGIGLISAVSDAGSFLGSDCFWENSLRYFRMVGYDIFIFLEMRFMLIPWLFISRILSFCSGESILQLSISDIYIYLEIFPMKILFGDYE